VHLRGCWTGARKSPLTSHPTSSCPNLVSIESLRCRVFSGRLSDLVPALSLGFVECAIDPPQEALQIVAVPPQGIADADRHCRQGPIAKILFNRRAQALRGAARYISIRTRQQPQKLFSSRTPHEV